MKQKLLPYQLQFFADGEPEEESKEPKEEPKKEDETKDPKEEPEEKPEKTPEELNVELLAKVKMLEKKLDKTSEKLSTTEKKYQDVLTDAQKSKLEEAERKAEEAEELERLRKENAITKFEKNFLALGYPEELATEAAEAQYENDPDTLNRLQAQFLAIHDKQKEAEWQKKRPLPKSGTDEEGAEITLDELNRMSYLKQVEFKQKHPEAYKKLRGGN